MCLRPSSAEARSSALAAHRIARRKGYCWDIIRRKSRPGEGIRLGQELHSGGQFQLQAKPLIQVVQPE